MLLNNYCCKTKQGFTLTELLITITIVVILFALAIPNFRVLVIENQLSAQTNSLVSGLSLSRSEAVKRGARVTLCQSANGTSCVTTGGYDQGWIVFLDADENGTRPGSNPDDTEPVIRRFDAMSDSASTTANVNSTNYISYLSTGRIDLPTTFVEPGPDCTDDPVKISICMQDGLQRNICVHNGGRISSKQTTTVCP